MLLMQGVSVWQRKVHNVGAAHSWVAVAKSQLCRDIVALGFAVLFSDADVLFLGNPMDALVQDRDVESSTDAFGWSGYSPAGDNVHVDAPEFPPIHFHVLPQLNAGFFLVQPSRRTAVALHHWYLWVSSVLVEALRSYISFGLLLCFLNATVCTGPPNKHMGSGGFFTDLSVPC